MDKDCKITSDEKKKHLVEEDRKKRLEKVAKKVLDSAMETKSTSFSNSIAEYVTRIIRADGGSDLHLCHLFAELERHGAEMKL